MIYSARGFFSPTRVESLRPKVTQVQPVSVDERPIAKSEPGKKPWLQLYLRYGDLLRRFGMVVLVVAYTAIGAAIFHYVEGPHDKVEIAEAKAKVKKVCKEMINKIGIASSDSHSATCADVLYARFYGDDMSFARNDTWSYGNSAFFSATVYTTIGYGSPTPSTENGKIAVMVYATFGIPLFLVLMTEIGSVCNDGVRCVWGSFLYALFVTCGIADKRTKAENRIAQNNGRTIPVSFFIKMARRRPLPILMTFCVMYLYMALAASIMMFLNKAWWAEKNFLTSFYFVFQTMSTVGFGDVMPDPSLFVYTVAVIFFGLAILSMCMSNIQDYIQQKYESGMASGFTGGSG